MFIRLFIILFISSLLIARDQQYYMENFNIDFNNPKIYEDVKILSDYDGIFLDNKYFHIVYVKINFSIKIVCINKIYNKYTVLIGEFITGEDSFDLVLSADEIKNIDRFLNFFEIDDPTKNNLLNFKK